MVKSSILLGFFSVVCFSWIVQENVREDCQVLNDEIVVGRIKYLTEAVSIGENQTGEVLARAKSLLTEFAELQRSNGVDPQRWWCFSARNNLVFVSRESFKLEGGLFVTVDKAVCQSHLRNFGTCIISNAEESDDAKDITDPILDRGSRLLEHISIRIVYVFDKGEEFSTATPEVRILIGEAKLLE